MKNPSVIVIVSFFLLIASPSAEACGTRSLEQQEQIDSEQLAKLKSLTIETAKDADVVVIGKVTALVRPVSGSERPGTVSLAVSETLKGAHSSTRTIRWKEAFVLSCQPADSFRNVGFRQDGRYIVYVKDGMVLRSAPADELRSSSLLKLSEERMLVASQVDE